MKRILAIIAVAIAAAFFYAPQSQALPLPEGTVRFWKRHDPDMDSFSTNATWHATINARYKGLRVFESGPDLNYYTGTALLDVNAYGIPSHGCPPSCEANGSAQFLRDAAGNPCFIPYPSGGPYVRNAGDTGDLTFRENRKTYILNTLAAYPGEFDGVLMDDVNLDDPDFPGISRVSCGDNTPAGNNNSPIDPRTGLVMTGANWNKYMAEWMEDIRDEPALIGKPIQHNSIWYITPFTDQYLLRQIQAADMIHMEFGFVDSGLTSETGSAKFRWTRKMDFVDLVHANGALVVDRDEVANEEQQQYGLANYFMLNKGEDFYESTWESLPDDVWHAYGIKRLGLALGSRYLWNGVQRRDFTAGYVLVNPPGGATTVINLGTFGSITLAERQGEVVTTCHDLNNDGVVNFGDIGMITSRFGETVPPAPWYVDVKRDGVISFGDHGLVNQQFNHVCP